MKFWGPLFFALKTRLFFGQKWQEKSQLYLIGGATGLCFRLSLRIIHRSSIESLTSTESLISSTAILPELSISKIRNAQLTSSLNLKSKVSLIKMKFRLSIKMSHFVDPTISIAIINSMNPMLPPPSVSITLCLKISHGWFHNLKSEWNVGIQFK